MLESIMLGFSNVMQPVNLLICLGGLFVGVLFGALPGFSATMAVAIFVPFTYVLEPGPALLLLSALYCGGVYGWFYSRCSGRYSRYPRFCSYCMGRQGSGQEG